MESTTCQQPTPVRATTILVRQQRIRLVCFLALFTTVTLRTNLAFQAALRLYYSDVGQWVPEHQTLLETYNTLWKQSINETITCNPGKEYGKASTETFPMSPHLIIIGAQKAGTSALGTWLDTHPLLQNADGEAHFFDNDPFLLANLGNLDDEDTLCKLRWRYHFRNWPSLTKKDDRGKILFEKTPRYMILPNVPRLIQQVCPWNPKIIAVLRDPIARLQSHYKMNWERKSGTFGLSLDQAIHAELQVMRATGWTQAPLRNENSTREDNDVDFAIPEISLLERETTAKLLLEKTALSEYWMIQRGMYSVHLESWLQYYRIGIDLHVIQYERMLSEPVQVWHEVQDFLQVPRHDLSEEFLGSDYSPHYSSHKKGTQRTTEAADTARLLKAKFGQRKVSKLGKILSNETAQLLRTYYKPYNNLMAALLAKSLQVPQHELYEERIGGENTLNVGNYTETLSNETTQYLKKFYRPYNDRLADLLGEEWRGVWD